MAKKILKPGTPLGGGFFAGEMISGDDRYALVIPSKAEGEKMNLQYKLRDRSIPDGTDSDDDGMANSEKINDDNHPAAQFCRSLRAGGVDDWSLPSRDELAIIERTLGPRRKNTPALFREGGAEAFEPTWYWSSTEHASYSNGAWLVDFLIGLQNDYLKSNCNGVRAVRRLKI
jgi:hypothetical protein